MGEVYFDGALIIVEKMVFEMGSGVLLKPVAVEGVDGF
jgi:hypothetical protein